MSGRRKWQLFVKGIEGKTKIVEVTKDCSIDDLLHKVSDLTQISVETQIVLYCSKQLYIGSGKDLSDYGIQNNSNLFVVLRLHGGSLTSEVPPKELDDDVELSDLPDMISWDDDPESKRAKMPCGHAIGPESLTAFCRSLLDNNKYRFNCPYIDPTKHTYCGREWEYILVRRLAVLTPAEIKEFEVKISENYMKKGMGIQECPGCNSLCKRINRNDRRVGCPLCTHKNELSKDFCWYCLRTWKTCGTVNCGNSECTGEDPRLNILKNASKKIIVGVHNCPSRRACPTCGMLIEHEKACKHMVCPCGQQFCFICLTKPAANGSYQCGSYNSHCTVAPVQTTIPGD